MARTKQTARRCTGGKAPRKRLATKATKLTQEKKKKPKNKKQRPPPPPVAPYRQRCVNLCKRHCPAMTTQDQDRFANDVGMFLGKHTSVAKKEALLNHMTRILTMGSSRACVPFGAFKRPIGAAPLGTDLYADEAYLEWAKRASVRA